MSYDTHNQCGCPIKHRSTRRYHYHIQWADQNTLDPTPYGSSEWAAIYAAAWGRKWLYMVRTESYVQEPIHRGKCKFKREKQ